MIIIPSLLSEQQLANDIAFCAVMRDEALCQAIVDDEFGDYSAWRRSTVEYDV